MFAQDNANDGPQAVHDLVGALLAYVRTAASRGTPVHEVERGIWQRWPRIPKEGCIRPGTPLTLEDARRIVARFVEHYNTVRLHPALGYFTPKDKLEGREQGIFAARDRKLEAARERRKERRHAARQATQNGQPANTGT